MHFLITAGPTREYIDPVRYISNASSGKMGFAIARAAVAAGDKVTLIATVTDMKPPAKAKVINVETSKEMLAQVKSIFPKCDCLIMAAAVADYAPVKISKTKIKKTGETLTLKLKPTADILKWAGLHKKKNQIVAGFALEDKAIRAGGEKKFREKNLDMVIVNTPAAIGVDKSSVQIKTTSMDWLKIENTAKIVIARKIISLVNQQACAR